MPYSELADLAAELAQLGGSMLLRESGHRSLDVLAPKAKSFATDVVTRTDLAIEAALVERIAATFPEDGILTEERAAVSSGSRRCWVIDPLDGTSNYVRGLWPSVVSVGVEVEGVPVAGAVCDPFHGETYKAAQGTGAFRNGVRIQCNRDASLAHSYVSIGGAEPRYASPMRPRALLLLGGAADSVRDLGATALQLCYVADGRFDAHVALSVQKWDVAAGFVIAREAGCAVASIAGVAPVSAVVAPPALVGSIERLLAATRS